MAIQATVPKPGDILVMVGTKKGMFLFWSDDERKTWQRSMHHLGWGINAISYDARHGSIYAATNSEVFGALVQRSDDGGVTWHHENHGLDFAPDSDARVRETWQVVPGHIDRPNEVWAGTGEAGLFRSQDRGLHWEALPQLNMRRDDDGWFGGGGGLILHTIIPDPVDANRVYAAVSAGGGYRSEDNGTSWQPINKNVLADFLPEPYPETGQCVHKMVIHPARPNVLYQQNHCGVYRSEDRGTNWIDISDGLPSRFGLPMVVHPHDPETIYVVPLVGPEQRFVPDGQMAVWRSRDSGSSWQKLDNGLPPNAYFMILRECLAADPCESAGIYVGTTTGQVFFSRDEGEQWETLVDYLPPVYSVSAARVVGE